MIQARHRAADVGNYSLGRQGKKVELIVVHLMDGSQEGTAAWFANPRANASAHYGVSSEGDIDQYVSEADTAWHAGKWGVNIRSIGIEHEGRQESGKPRWQPTNTQFHASVRLAADICHHHGIEPSAATIIPHSATFPGKPLCPGDGFPLLRYIAAVRQRLEDLRQEVETNIPVRLFDPVTNQQIGAGTLIRGSDKVYLKHADGKVES